MVPFANYPDYRTERPVIHHMPPAAYSAPAQHARQPMPEPESAWERGLRTAKEMMRKASKRKEQDMDFDDKKMNLSLTIDEAEKDNYYNRASPEVSFLLICYIVYKTRIINFRLLHLSKCPPHHTLLILVILVDLSMTIVLLPSLLEVQVLVLEAFKRNRMVACPDIGNCLLIACHTTKTTN